MTFLYYRPTYISFILVGVAAHTATANTLWDVRPPQQPTRKLITQQIGLLASYYVIVINL